ncbi:MAG: hypothetical protein ACI4JV_06270 [Ruminiclostridium sp.]
MDAYQWSNRVGAGRTDRNRPQLQWMRNHTSTHRHSPYEKTEIKADEQALRGNSMERQV